MSARQERGFSLAETVVVLGLVAGLLMTAALLSPSLLGRESVRSAVYEVQGQMRLARAEALSRNRDCRFVLDTTSRKLSVLDSMGTVSTADDELLHESELPTAVQFAHPEAGAPVTLASLGGSSHGVVFSPDGTADAGGEVTLVGGTQFRKLELFVAGGQRVSHWSGSTWAAGG